MVLPTAALIPLVPVALGAVALGRVVFETAREDRAMKQGADGGAVLAALTTLALFLLSLDALPAFEARAFLGLLGASLWLAGRARHEARLVPLFCLAAGLLAGAELRFGLALLPALAVLCFAAARGPAALRGLSRILFVLLLGAAVGWATCRYGLRRELIAPQLFDARSLAAWALATAQRVGAIGMGFAAAGLLLGLLGAGARRVLSLACLALVAMDAASGAFGAATSVAVALAVGLGLMEARLSLMRLALPGASMALVPLTFLALIEPLGARLESQHYTWPDLGPVPPHEELVTASPRGGAATPLRHAPARGSVADTVRR